MNNTNKLKFLKAEDMFEQNTEQIFCAKTGKYLGIVRDGKFIIGCDDDGELIEEQPKANINQLNLFE